MYQHSAGKQQNKGDIKVLPLVFPFPSICPLSESLSLGWSIEELFNKFKRPGKVSIWYFSFADKTTGFANILEK